MFLFLKDYPKAYSQYLHFLNGRYALLSSKDQKNIYTFTMLKIISISEDFTKPIGQVDYDKEKG